MLLGPDRRNGLSRYMERTLPPSLFRQSKGLTIFTVFYKIVIVNVLNTIHRWTTAQLSSIHLISVWFDILSKELENKILLKPFVPILEWTNAIWHLPLTPNGNKLLQHKGMNGARPRSLSEEWQNLCTPKYSRYGKAVRSRNCHMWAKVMTLSVNYIFGSSV
jgi:hypothetical protein